MEDKKNENELLDDENLVKEDDFTRGSDEDSIDEINFVLVETEEEKSQVLTEKDFQDKLHEEEYLKFKSAVHDDEPQLFKKRTFSKLMVVVLIFALVGGFTAGAGYRAMDYYLFNQPETSVKYIPEIRQEAIEISSNTVDITGIAKNLEPSVVAITNEVVQNTFFGSTTGSSAGSGVVFDVSSEKVYILTNHHVIDSSNALSVTFFGDDHYQASIIGSDQDTDLAVITVDIVDMDQEVLNKIRPIELGDSDALQVGETAIAIGNPLGYNNTVTVGIISALDRAIGADLNALNLIQTDAAINPGNSGGALVNGAGQLVGINTVKISDTAVEGIGFAIPINDAIPILEQLIETGTVPKPYIGIYGQDVSSEMVETHSIPAGVIIADTVENSPAEASGLQRFDIITKVDDMPIESMADLVAALRQYNIGDTVAITVMRDSSRNNEKSNMQEFVFEIVIADKNDIIKATE